LIVITSVAFVKSMEMASLGVLSAHCTTLLPLVSPASMYLINSNIKF
jgi:hypothetical protein